MRVRSLLLSRLSFSLALVLPLVACGGSAEPSEPTPASQQRNAPRSVQDPESPFTANAVWKDAPAQARIEFACGRYGSGAHRACIRGQMQASGVPLEAGDFYDATGRWLLGFIDSPGKLKAGLVLVPGVESPIPQVAFLRGKPTVQEAIEVLSDAFPPSKDGSFRPFESDPMYRALFAAAQSKFRNADDPLDLRHFDIAELEASTTTASGGQEFIVQVGIHNFCASCGVGVAARYAFAFDKEGSSTGVKLVGLCQGRTVTREVQGLGKVSFHEFSGVNPGRAGVSEPYLLLVPGLSTCPEHMNF